MTTRTPLVVLAVASMLALFGGCAAVGDPAFEGGGLAGSGSTRGQSIVFVGTDATTLATNIYVAEPLFLDDYSDNVLDAEEFEVRALTSLQVGPDSALQAETDELLPSFEPFALPDRSGERVALLVSSFDPETGQPVGRVAVVYVGTGQVETTHDVPGLTGVRFTSTGSHMIFEHVDPDTGLDSLSAVPGAPPWNEARTRPLGPEAPYLSVELAGLVPDTDDVLALTTDQATGRTDTWRLSPEGLEEPVNLTAGAARSTASPALSPDGTLLAVTLLDSDTGRRDIAVIDLGGFQAPEPGEPRIVNTANGDADPASDCYWPSWSPQPDELGRNQLAYVCENLATSRPDVHLYVAEPTSGQDNRVTLTSGAQTGVPDNSMDGLVIRGRLQWDPSGELIVFGASNEEDAVNGDGMTLLALRPADGSNARALPIFAGSQGFADFAHFSAASPQPVLLVWDKSQTGLNDAGGDHPIQLVAADPEDTHPAVGVRLQQDLFVSYPLFLGENSLFYP